MKPRTLTGAMLPVLFLWTISTAAGALAAASTAPAAAPPASVAAGKLDIHELRLDNGLRIFVLERPLAPTFAAYYQFGVGGTSDPAGRTGIAHLLEHMMFKGTTSVGTLDAAREAPLLKRLSELWHDLDGELDRDEDPFRRPDSSRIRVLEKEIDDVTNQHKKLVAKNEFDELMSRAGGVSENASTSNDVTNYFIELPANQLELWFQLESDRLLHPVFREFWSERDVVHEERRTSVENQAEGLGFEALESLVFRAHPYRNPVIGWPRDIARLEQEDALAYFRTYYSPSNCVMVFVGDVRTADIERRARKYFGAWRRQAIPPPSITTEPDQHGARRAVVEFDAEPSLAMAWRTVPEGHPDQYALDLLARILGGLNSSRLDKSIVQGTRIATSCASWHDSRKWSGYLAAAAYLEGGHTVAELEPAMEREIEKIQESGVTADELERAKIRSEISRVRSLKSNLGQANRIGDAVGAAGTLDYLYARDSLHLAVTAADVQAVAKKYLQPSRACVVEVRKTPGASGSAGEPVSDVHHRGGTPEERGARHSVGFARGMSLIEHAPPIALEVPEVGKDVDRVVLPCGVTVYIEEDHSAPSVDMRFTWLGGSNTTPVRDLAPFQLVSGLLTEGGTEQLDPIALQDKKEQLGLSARYWMGGTESGGSFWSLSRNFDESFSLAMDMLMRPRFDAKRLETLEGQYIDGMKRRTDDPGGAAWWIQHYVLDRDHPRLGYDPSKKEIRAVTPADIRKIWRRYMGRDNLYITAVGDFDKHTMLDLIQKTFASWRTAEEPKRDYIARSPVVRPGLYVVEKEVSAPAVSVIHQIDVDRRAPLGDHAALEILNDILGGNGFRSRLMERLRSDEGLTYGVSSYISHDGRPGVPGAVGAQYESKKTAIARSIASVVDEFQKIARTRVAPAEVKEQIDAWRNRFVFNYTNTFSSVTRLMSQELDERPYDYDKQLLDAVQKVTPDDVERVAKQYLKPGNLTISVFGTLTDEDRAELGKSYTLTVLPKEQVFRGGYDETEVTGTKKRE